MAEEVMTKKEVSAYLKISMPTLERWMRAGILPVVKLGRLVLLHKESLDAVLPQHEQWREPNSREIAS
jgi:excisionase family DNA binding protein